MINTKLFFTVLLSFISLIFLFLFVSYTNSLQTAFAIESGSSEENLFCDDGTPYASCSFNKPYFCQDGILMQKATICGCQEVLTKNGSLCISKYQTKPKNITLKYILRGNKKEINFTVYGGMANYISNISRIISYNNKEKFSRLDFKLQNINEKEQRELLLPLVVEIQNIAESKEDQARIAISIVQNIDFGQSDKKINFSGLDVPYSRYPYEVIYDMEGICGEKSELLVFLLKEMGYKTSFFDFKSENHEAVGIGCPTEFSLGNSGYCFIETTGPSIITDNKILYSMEKTLSSNPEITVFSDGNSLGSDLYEYEDVKEWIKIRDDIEKNGKISFFKYFKWKRLMKKYGIEEEYNI